MERKGSRSITSGDGNPVQMDSIALMQKLNKDETHVVTLLQKSHNYYAKGKLFYYIFYNTIL